MLDKSYLIILSSLKVLFWKIGKDVYDRELVCSNIIEKYSNYYTYYFGNSFLFTRENIHLMKRFYMNFPIYYDALENFSWEQYKLLLAVENKKERYFYFSLLLLFHSDYEETLEFIYNQYYLRI